MPTGHKKLALGLYPDVSLELAGDDAGVGDGICGTRFRL
jgi:hypothetical protein